MSHSVSPKLNETAFTCPYCGVYTTQAWAPAFKAGLAIGLTNKVFAFSECFSCKGAAIWLIASDNYGGEYGKMIFPLASNAPMPVEDMPENIKSDFLEARNIAGQSPRGAAALLRLCVQNLMPILGEKGEKIDDDIKSLVKKGLPIEIQQALDTLRVIGNSAVHPGTLDLKDDVQTVSNLFGLLNFIVERMITHPKRVSALFNKLPQSNLEAIRKRDNP
jgi:hypothetical protein